MKYIFTRITILILGVVIIYYISVYSLEKARAEGRGFCNEGDVCFFRLILLLAIASIGVFSYELYKFNKQSKIKERNRSFVFIFSILLLVIVFGGYFMQYVGG
ncbi:hypothetical protein FNW52_03715 [Flavobacterium sp. ZT3R18]|uniref:hypothetical protein n=1 Tax=Flavobacterium sp. ZT3R18 TaxID=2594429 RepID=UPI00117B3019|nr:hypothetical protein [Flavobacterium sp. ZT3R18]TRX38019.1 hypothetical protein FNW52_03715 [Flavobacterium sp. ZT3R18]